MVTLEIAGLIATCNRAEVSLVKSKVNALKSGWRFAWKRHVRRNLSDLWLGVLFLELPHEQNKSYDADYEVGYG